MKRFVVYAFLLLQLTSRAEDVYPAHWWTGMKNPILQIMLHSDSISFSKDASVMLKYPGVKLLKTEVAKNPHYLFITIHISPQAKPGKMNFTIHGND